MAPPTLSPLLLACSVLALLSLAPADDSVCQNLKPSPLLTKFVDRLPLPGAISLSPTKTLIMGAYKISQKLHRDLPPTTLYAYGTSQATATYPGPALVATRGVPTKVKWENHIYDKQHILAVDKTIHWANPKKGGVPIVTHIHGGENPSTSDGHPEAWFTAFGERGPTWSTSVYTYPNNQFPSLLLYHDHAMGMTRLNVFAGLVGPYLLTWPQIEKKFQLPSGEFDVPLIIQDKQFYANGSLNFPNVGDVPTVHPNWCPEFFGDTILVNGKVWPYLNVQARKYRFRFVNGANARFFTLSFSSSAIYFLKIGTDGGYLEHPRKVSTMTLGPAYRVDVIVDFSGVQVGTDIFLRNSAPAPFPTGSIPSGGTELVMKFHVVPAKGNIQIKFPPIFHPSWEKKVAKHRIFTLNEVTDANDLPLRVLINNSSFHDPITEKPKKNTAEIWEIINLTGDAHPMHIHLLQFQMLNRQGFDLDKYENGSCSFAIPYSQKNSCYTEKAKPPGEDEIGWKDTFVAWPGNTTRLLLKFTSQDGTPFAFDSTKGPGYVWHCHITDHEDNDMMRPFIVTK